MAQRAAGRPSAGVNVPAAFGEKVHHEPKYSGRTAGGAGSYARAAPICGYLDVRTLEEWGNRQVCASPAERASVPGGDLILWADRADANSDAATGGQTAPGGRAASSARRPWRRLGLTNAGAQESGKHPWGWALAGLELETKPARSAPAAPSGSRHTRADGAKAAQIAAEEKLRRSSRSHSKVSVRWTRWRERMNGVSRINRCALRNRSFSGARGFSA